MDPPAHELQVTVFGHANFGDVEIRRGGVGLSAGYLGERLGVEIDAALHGHYYKDSRLGIPNACGTGETGPCVDNDSDAVVFMLDVLVPIPVPETSRWTPLGELGVGVNHAWIHDAGPYDSEQTNLAVNAGGGVLFRAKPWLAIRADARFLHVFVGSGHEGGYPDDYNFVRIALGVTLTPWRLPREP